MPQTLYMLGNWEFTAAVTRVEVECISIPETVINIIGD
jgi:hypothetical protein